MAKAAVNQVGKGASDKVVLFVHMDRKNKKLLKMEAEKHNLSITQLVENILGRYLQKAAVKQ